MIVIVYLTNTLTQPSSSASVANRIVTYHVCLTLLIPNKITTLTHTSQSQSQSNRKSLATRKLRTAYDDYNVTARVRPQPTSSYVLCKSRPASPFLPVTLQRFGGLCIPTTHYLNNKKRRDVHGRCCLHGNTGKWSRERLITGPPRPARPAPPSRPA
jgi:hypothetical protein